MLAAVGDLVEDIVARLLDDVNVASDTDAVLRRRRGGSAANVVAAACVAGRPARFIGAVGDDAPGEWLVRELIAAGADACVRRAGRTGTIIVLLDRRGERTMLTDRGACASLAHPEPQWLDGVHTLHVPMYSMVDEPLATTTRTLVRWAHARGITVSVDLSSVALLEKLGSTRALEIVALLRPQVLLANELESAVFGRSLDPASIGAQVLVVKHGGQPAIVTRPGEPDIEVPAERIADVRDTTGAGDAFAAGMMLALADGATVLDAVRAGHTLAATIVRTVSA